MSKLKFKKDNRILESVRQRALQYYKERSVPSRNPENFITECYLDSACDELVKIGLLKIQYDGSGAIEYYINEEFNESGRNQAGNTSGNKNAN